MIKIFDFKCKDCSHVWEMIGEPMKPKEPNPPCPECSSTKVVRLPGGLKHFKAKDPYDYLDKPMPDAKKIVSGKHYRSK